MIVVRALARGSLLYERTRLSQFGGADEAFIGKN
jgi:hypothetical protein